MQIAVSDLIALDGLPNTKMGVHKWLQRNSVPLLKDGQRFTFLLSDLPEPVRRAVIERDIATSGLPAGEYDADAHDTFAAATPTMWDEAERKAAIARVLVTTGKGLPWSKREEIVQAKFGSKGVSKPSLMRLLKAVDGVDPINFAPALLADYCRDGAPVAEISHAAWSYFMTTIRDSGEQFPIIQAWRDVRDVAKRQGLT